MCGNAEGIYYAAPYYRISNDDGDLFFQGKCESNSISNQRSLVEEYVKNKPEIILCKERIDDGFSGVDFNRPAFQKMLEDVKCGKINCIIVKDLSRFGRNYIEAGRFIQKIFPTLGVRFIAINDHYDSVALKDTDDYITIPFKNLLNDSYSRDLSVKVRSQFAIKRKKGEFIGAFATYGYCKDDKNRNHLVIDEYAAAVVRDIFDWRLAGMNHTKIAERLNRMGILSPAEYKHFQGLRYKTGFKTNAETLWTPVAIKRILTNQTYIGCVVQGQKRTPNHKVKKWIYTKPEEWNVVGNMHEAVISEEKFRTVQKVLKMDTRTAPGKMEVYLFSGFLKCGDCGSNLVRKLVSAGRNATGNICKYPYYVCGNNKKNSCNCSSHMISEYELEQAVLMVLESHMNHLVDWNAIMDRLEKQSRSQLISSKYNIHFQKNNEKVAKYKNLKMGLYEDLEEGTITREEYFELKQYYDEQILQCEKQVKGLVCEQEVFAKQKAQENEWIYEFGKDRKLTKISRPMLLALVNQIEVFEKGRVKISFQFQYHYEAVIKAAK